MPESEYMPLREKLCVLGNERLVKMQNLEEALERVILGYLGPALYEKTDLPGWIAGHCEMWRDVDNFNKSTLDMDNVPFCTIHQEGKYGRVRLEWLVDERARW